MTRPHPTPFTNSRYPFLILSFRSRLRRHRCAASLLFVIGFVCSTAFNVHGQSAEFTQGNKSSSAVSLEVPLGNYPGRGISLPVSLHYSSQGLWRVGFINSVYANTYVGIVRQSVTEAIFAEYSTAGWTTSLDVPKVEWPKLNDRYYANGKPYANGYIGGYTFRIARVFIHMPDGSTHELRKADAVYPDNNYVDMSGTFYAVDGSRMRYDSSDETTGILYLSNGTRYILNGSTIQYIDRNGNTLNYNATNRQWTDTLGRVISTPWPVNPGAGDYTYSLPGMAGVNGSLITYTLKFRSLSDVFLPDVSGQTQKPIANRYLPTPYANPTNWNGGNFPQGPGSSYLFASAYTDPEETEQSYVHVVGRGQSGFTNFNPVVLAEIDLPNGQNYRFFYNAYGELDKVIFPTGGYQRYQYGPVSTIGFTGVPYAQASRGMLSRWISPSGSGSDEAQWTYSASAYPRVVTAPDATGAPNGTRSETYLYLPATYYDNDFGYEEALLGTPIEERIYAPASQGGAMLRRTLIEYAQSSVTINKPVPQYFPGTYTAYRNARPIKTVSLILDTGGNALVHTSTMAYDLTYQFTVGLDATSTSDYAFATVDQTTAQTAAIGFMPTGALVRSTQTAYLTTSNSNYLNRNILGLPTSTTIYNGAGGIVAQSAVTYDQGTFPLLTYASVAGWTDPQTSYRGNATTTSRWLDYPTATWIEAHAQYDQCGSVRKTWDARDTSLQNPTQIDYSSAYSYAYPTTTISSIPDSSGTHGSTTSLVATSVYDFNTGLVTSTTDANGKTTTFEYNESLNRPTKVIRPDGGWTATSYGDTPGNIYVHTQTLRQSSPTQQVIDGYGYFDNLGRSVRSFIYDGTGSTPWIVSDTYYDSLGRVSSVSNPYRVSGASGTVPATCSTCTTTEYDSLGRAFRVTTPDGAQLNTAYSASTTGSYLGTTVTATDQAGKVRKSITDAQGRLIQVIEDPGNLAWATNYTYDTLNNLRKVDQGGQLRYFGYDSLSRLIRVRHVEQAVNAALNWTDPVTGYNGGWTMGFSYDANGNATSRIDARNITRSTTYDALNRPTVVLYRINNQPDPNTGDVEYLYDNAAENGRGRPWITFKWGSQPFQTAVGRYDSAGRIKQLYRMFGNGQGGWYPAYEIDATYDVAGHMTSQTYPSGHIVTYGYDTAGRLNNFAGNLGDGSQRSYSTAIGYSPFGMEQEQFGTQTQLYRKLHYNVRGQLYDVRVSTSSLTQNEWDWNRGALVFYFGGYGWGQSGPSNNGTPSGQQHWMPADDAYSTYWYTQDNYGYDSLNRISSTNEVHGGPWGQSGTDYVQAYNYDRFGNRTVDQALTTANVPRPAYTVDTNTNRLVAPAGYSYGYDEAGNQNFDNYTGEGSRTFDAENRIKQAWAYNRWQTYTYDGDGERIRRLVNGTETWQVTGISGELLAEYAPIAAPTSPQKEYGYRNGELLIIASGGSCGAGYTSPKTWLATSGSLYHLTGVAEGTNWAAYAGVHSAQTLSYGPYDSSFGQGHHTAQFTLMVDNNSGADVVGTLDVVTNLGNTVLAQRQIRRSDFAAANQWQTFTLQFDNPCFGQTEARMWWNGNTTTKFSQVTITPISVTTPRVQWLVSDRLGTPRMVLDQTGSLSGISRHDYLPFGEEVFAGIGGRTTAQGYSGDGTRQHFTGYEMDAETGLNFAQARYQSSVQGRFTSVDPLGASATVGNPQSFNRYSYVLNSPTNLTDPFGLIANDSGTSENGAERGTDEPPGDPFETGSDIVAAAMNRFDGRVADTIFAHGLNQLISSGRMTRDEAEAAIEGNPNLAIEDVGYGDVIKLERETTEHYVDFMLRDLVYGPIPYTLSCLVGIDSDVTTATIRYSAEPTADPLGSQQPKYGLYSGDDRGHIIGQALGGPPAPDNLFSQHPTVNRGAYRTFETDIRRTLTEHKNWVAKIKVTLVYTPPQTKRCIEPNERERYLRPLGVQYSVSYTNAAGKAVGKPASKWFSN